MVIVSLLVIAALGFIIYSKHSSKSMEDYVTGQEDFYETKVNNFEFYTEGVSETEAVTVSMMFELMGVQASSSVGETLLDADEDEPDMFRDVIVQHVENVDFSMPVYFILGDDYYFVFSDTDGNLRGMHVDDNYELVELR